MGNASNVGVAAPRVRVTRAAKLERIDPGWARAFSGDSLDEEVEQWTLGAEYLVPPGGITTREAPFGRVRGACSSDIRVILLKTVEESGVLWGLIDALQLGEPRWAVLAVTDEQKAASRADQATPPGTGPFLERVGPGWEVGQSYAVIPGTIFRASPDLNSEWLCEQTEEEWAEILEIGLHEKSADGRRTRLRVKVMTWRTHTAGWISCVGEEGHRLLTARHLQKLDLNGRSAQLFHVSLPSFGGA